MKKFITMFLASVCLTALCATPALAYDFGKYNIDWSGYVAKYSQWLEVYKKNVAIPDENMPEEIEVKITYNANGGIFYNAYASPAVTSTKSVVVNAGETHKVISAKPTKGIYVFNGWRDADGNVYKYGDEIAPDEDMTLTAMWKLRTY